MAHKTDPLRESLGDSDPLPELVPEHLLMQWIERIRNGERSPTIDGLARAVLQDFCLRQWSNRQQSAVTLAWLADVLSETMDFQDARHLLGLSPRPKKRPPDPWRPAGEVALWLKLAEAAGHTPAAAVAMAADAFHRDTKTIERYRREGTAMLKWWNDDPCVWADYFKARKPPVPLPEGWSEKSGLPAPTRGA